MKTSENMIHFKEKHPEWINLNQQKLMSNTIIITKIANKIQNKQNAMPCPKGNISPLFHRLVG